MNLKRHTILLLVGPSNCGKTTFAEKVKKEFSCLHNVQHISSDNIRRELLGKNLHKYDKRMLQVSEQAFYLLETKLKAATSYPVNADIVIVDSTGLDEKFREKIVKIAKDKDYNIDMVLFDFKDRQEYFNDLEDSDNNGWIVEKHVKRLKRDVLGNLKRRDYNQIHKITSKTQDTHITLEGNIDHHLIDSKPYLIVGDVHGCLDELKELIRKAGLTINDNDVVNCEEMGVVLAGDWIDKTPSIPMIEFLHKNPDINLVKGNHENFVYKYLLGELKSLPPQEVIDEQFTTIAELEKNEPVFQKFANLVERSLEYVQHQEFIVTHAPCDIKYLGKDSGKALTSQRNFRYGHLNTSEVIEYLTNFSKQSRGNYPTHVFGHISFSEVFRRNGKIGLDTGCYAGHKLSGVILGQNKPVFLHVASKQEKKEVGLLEIPKIRQIELDPRERGRMFWAARDKINFISGTMSPSDKNEDTLESMETALEYYKSKGINKVCLQKKYMGSRCTVYLHRDIEKCYATSRKGFLIKPERVDMSEAFKDLQDRLFSKAGDDVEYFVIDSELLPWYALGEGLVEERFKPYLTALRGENELLLENGFINALEVAKAKAKEVDLTKSKKELIDELGHHNYTTLKNVNNFVAVEPEEQEKWLRVYERQLELFAQEGEVEVKPFALLKTVFKDGSEKLHKYETNENVFNAVSEDEYLVVDVDDIEAANNFYQEIAGKEEMEGVVVKPEIVYNETVAPFLKVRNPNYLTLVYGCDYFKQSKFEKLLRQKRINRKLGVSVEEFKLGWDMLGIPLNQVNEENEVFLNLVAQMIGTEKKEEGLDPRL